MGRRRVLKARRQNARAQTVSVSPRQWLSYNHATCNPEDYLVTWNSYSISKRISFCFKKVKRSAIKLTIVSNLTEPRNVIRTLLMRTQCNDDLETSSQEMKNEFN
jgi:hypothetical protein